MGFDLIALSKQLGRIAKAAKDAEAELKTIHKTEAIEANPFVVGKHIHSVQKSIETLEETPALLTSLATWQREAVTTTNHAQERYKTTLAADLARQLAAMGHAVEGRIPELRVGLLTLELRWDDGIAKIWYGPKIELLDKVTLDATELCNATAASLSTLSNSPMDEVQFLHDFLKAWRIALLRVNGANVDLHSIPIGTMLAEFTLIRQPPAFWSNPSRTTFVNYGRVQLSYDLHRLSLRVIDNMEFRLIVATRDQTKDPNTSLWIPRTIHGEGTHFSAISFRPTNRDS